MQSTKILPSVRIDRHPSFKGWWHFQRYWSGRIWMISVRSYTLVLDFRRCWIKDFLGQ